LVLDSISSWYIRQGTDEFCPFFAFKAAPSGSATSPIFTPQSAPKELGQARGRGQNGGGRLHKQAARTPEEKERVRGEMEATDEAMDGLVYELYGLSPDEIKVVEGKA
jgi:hypothetical protein